MQPAATQQGFGTLTIIGIIVLLLLITGIGQYIWRSATQIGAHCRDAVTAIGWYDGQDFCESIGQSMVMFQRHLEGLVGQTGSGLDLEQYSGELARQFSTQAIGFSSPNLSGLIDPNMLSNSIDLGNLSGLDRMRFSVTQGAYGSQLLGQGNTSQGLSYLQSSARMGDSGVLSQLQLGSAYGSGSFGLPKDPGRARQYNDMAVNSILSLQKNDSPAAHQVLKSLPGKPNDLVKQLKGLR